jgi:hypothetical protein
MNWRYQGRHRVWLLVQGTARAETQEGAEIRNENIRRRIPQIVREELRTVATRVDACTLVQPTAVVANHAYGIGVMLELTIFGESQWQVRAKAREMPQWLTWGVNHQLGGQFGWPVIQEVSAG